MRKREKVFIANRPLLYAFCALIAGILLAFGFGNDSVLLVTMSVITFAVLLLLLIRNRWALCVVVLVGILIGIGGYCFSIFDYQNRAVGDEIYVVEGRIGDSFKYENTYTYVVLKDCKITLDDEVVAKGKISLFITGEREFNFGDVISFEAVVENEAFVKFNAVNYSLINDINYRAEIDAENISVIDNHLSLDERVRIAVKNNIVQNFSSPAIAGLNYAIIFGDKQLLEETIVEGFTYSGIAHLLAVSGSHFTILFGALAFLLSKVRMNKYARFGVILVLVVAFMWLCGFSPSVFRAGLMFIIMYSAFVYSKKYDMLNSLALSGVIILLLDPLDLFDVGFLLSYACVLGIILLNKPITKWLAFLKNKILASAIATCLSTSIVTMPFLLQYFGYFSVYGLLTNFLLLPLFEVAFVLLCLAIIIGFILPLAFMYDGLSMLFETMTQISKAIADLDYSIMYVIPLSITMSVLFVLGIFVLSKKLMMPIKSKGVLAIFICVIMVVSGFVGANKINNNMIRLDDNQETLCLYGSENTILNFPHLSYDIRNISQLNNNLMVTKIDNIIISDKDFIRLEKLKEFVLRYKVEHIYILENCYTKFLYLIEDEQIGEKTSIMLFDTAYDLGYNIKVVDYSTKCYYYEINVQQKTYYLIKNDSGFEDDDFILGELDALTEQDFIHKHSGYNRLPV